MDEKILNHVEEILEQWNIKENIFEKYKSMPVSEATKKHFESLFKDKVSLRKILENRYLNCMAEKIGININDLKGKTVKEKIDHLISLEGAEKYITSELDNYIDYQKTILFNMLNAVISDSQNKLRVKGKNYYELNSYNDCFFNTLLDLYEERNPNCISLLSNKLDDLDDDFIEILESGFKALAENDTTALEMDEFWTEWNLKFKPDYKEVYSLLEDVEVAVKYYVKAMISNDENKNAFEIIKILLTECAENIKSVAKDRMEFPDIDIDEVMRPAKEKAEKKRARSERTKEAWKKRKSENK